MNRYLLPCLAASLVLAACSPSAPESPAAAAPEVASSHGFGPEISAEDFSAHVRTLASDAFGGRAPGSAGEQLTVALGRASCRERVCQYVCLSVVSVSSKKITNIK